MPKTLLLADDSVTIQKVVGISFANEDVRIVTVDNGDDAVTRAKEIVPDIVLADVVMPGKSGYDVCAALKADPALAGVPVLLLTGTFETFDEERAARVGADGHITKPFEAQALVELVSARLASAKRKPAAQAAAPAATEEEPEPFDFLEAPETPVRRGSTGSARPVAREADDVFAFEAEPIDLETEDEAEVDLGNEATAARTALLFDDEVDPFAEAETVPPVSARRPEPTALDDAPDDITRLVLPADEDPVEHGGDPLGGLGEELAEPVTTAPDAAAAWDVSSDELSDPFSTQVIADAAPVAPAAPAARRAEPAPLFDADEAAAEFDLEPPRPAASVAAPAASAPLEPPAAALSEAARTQVHETLEKIAWEALGDVSERIVREAVARIEQVAWDVIPRLAETLIREEIRKLKGEE